MSINRPEGSGGGRGSLLYYSSVAASRTIARSFMSIFGIILVTRSALSLMPNNVNAYSNAYSLSGTYSFRASFKHPSFQMYGDLDFDWLGDISGAAVAVFHERSGKPARDCDLLISGDYSLAKDPGLYSATLTFTPVAADCPINHGKGETLRVDIFRRNDHGDLDLIETSSSDHRFFGVATLQSPGPFWSLTYLQFGKGRNAPL
jgi:hypothetical protein